MMKAVILETAGEPLKVGEFAAPPAEAAKGSLIVKIEALAVNPVDFKMAGFNWWGGSLPTVLGGDCSGVVESSGDERFPVGSKVFFTPQIVGPAHDRVFAEKVHVSADIVALVPEGLSMVDAASLPLAGCTAIQMIERAGINKGDTVLVHGGGGGVGVIAVQVAKGLGARVIATASGAKAALVKELGADDVIDYKKENFAEAANALTGGKGVNVVLDTVGGSVLGESLACSAYGVRMAYCGQNTDPEILGAAQGKNATLSGIWLQRSGDTMHKLAAWVKDGTVKAVVAKTYHNGLDDVPAALNELAAGMAIAGKICIDGLN